MNSLTRKNWLESRRQGLGATDIASLAGVGFMGPLDVYKSKVEPVPDEPEIHPLLEIGLATEDLNAALYSRRLDVKLIKPTLSRHPQYEWAAASLDRQTADAGRPVETKYTPFYSEVWGEQFTDQVPSGYIVQTQWQMECVAAVSADISALSGTGEHRIYRMDRNPDLIHLLIAIGQEFWGTFIARKVAPPSDWMSKESEKVTDICEQIVADKSLVLDEAAVKLAANYKELKAIEKGAKEQADHVKGQLVGMMGDAEKAIAGEYLLRRTVIAATEVKASRREAYIRFDIGTTKKKGKKS